MCPVKTTDSIAGAADDNNILIPNGNNRNRGPILLSTSPRPPIVVQPIPSPSSRPGVVAGPTASFSDLGSLSSTSSTASLVSSSDSGIEPPAGAAEGVASASDSEEGEEHFFEGVEKLLEVWFANGEAEDSVGGARHDCEKAKKVKGDLRRIPR